MGRGENLLNRILKQIKIRFENLGIKDGFASENIIHAG